MTLPAFGFVTVHEAPLAEGVAREAEWLAAAAREGRAVAHLWQGAPGFVVPRSYARRPRWDAACAASTAEGRPVQVRASGGGLVPQGPGLWNLSLAWPAPGAEPRETTALYRALTDELAAAFARLGVDARAQAVEGSFCDGRFNLAVGGRKLVGTAQAWRRIDGRPVVLAHAVIVVDADPAALTEAANRFEAACGDDGPRYRAEALTSLAQAWHAVHGDTGPAGFEARALRAIAERFARIVPPRAHATPSSTTPSQET
jgi:lipoate-protein ligase A